MYIHDDADAKTITRETVRALNECSRMVGKIGSSFTDAQFKEMETAIVSLENALNHKRGMSDA